MQATDGHNEKKVTHGSKKQSDGAVSEAKDHH